jgi:hypothetical protein
MDLVYALKNARPNLLHKTNTFHGSVVFSRGSQLWSYRIALQFMELKGSLPSSQKPAPVPILSQINP